MLEGVRVVDTLEEAVADCVWVVGTSSRRVEGKRRLSPRQVAPEAVERAAGGPVAIVFGDERSGMTNEEVWRCHDLSSVPTAPEQPSINLAQAVLLYAYELRVAALDRPEGPSTPPPSPPPTRPWPASRAPSREFSGPPASWSTRAVTGCAISWPPFAARASRARRPPCGPRRSSTSGAP